MNLEEAIARTREEVNRVDKINHLTGTFVPIEILKTLLTALDERYQKGYQDGFKQAKFDCEMDKLDGR